MLELLIPIMVALIVGGPAWWVAHRGRTENSTDHAIVADMLSGVLKNQGHAEIWRKAHDEKHDELEDAIAELTP
jgi:hypothetical protein